MKLQDMKRTKAETKAENDRYKGPADDGHSYGHHIELDHRDLGKLGISEMPKPGDEYHGQFHGRVIEASENADQQSQGPRRRVRVLLHHIGMEAKDGDGDAHANGADKDGPHSRRAGLRSAIEAAEKKASAK